MKSVKEIFIASVILFLLLAALMPGDGFMGDLRAFQLWGNYMYVYGVGNAYFAGSDLPPFYLYILNFHSSLFGPNEEISIFNSHIKIYTLVFDLAGAALVIFASVKDHSKRLFYWCLLALNVSYLFNTVIWGQVDAIGAALNFASIYAAYKNRWPLAMGLFILAFNFKFQSMFFLALLFILFVDNYKYLSKRTILKTVLSIIAVQIIIIFPFLHWGKLVQLVNIFTTSVDRYPFISYNAANLWQILYSPENPGLVIDKTIAFGLTIKSWGLIFFLTAALICFWPALYFSFLKIRKKIAFEKLSFEQIMLLGALIPLSLFFFATQMHERYSHNAWLFIAAFTFSSKKFFPLILFSVAYFLNMEAVLRSTAIPDLFIFRFDFIALLFATLIIYLVYQLYLSVFPLKKNHISDIDTLPVKDQSRI